MQLIKIMDTGKHKSVQKIVYLTKYHTSSSFELFEFDDRCNIQLWQDSEDLFHKIRLSSVRISCRYTYRRERKRYYITSRYLSVTKKFNSLDKTNF